MYAQLHYYLRETLKFMQLPVGSVIPCKSNQKATLTNLIFFTILPRHLVEYVWTT